MAWVAREAERYGATPEGLILAGESAGANLALSAGLATRFEPTNDDPARASWKVLHEAEVPIDALSLGCGVYQVSDIQRLHRGGKLPLVHRQVLQAMEDAYLPRSVQPGHMCDPVRLLEEHRPVLDLAPAHVFCGTADPLLADSQRLVGALEGHDTHVSYAEYEGEPHAFHAAQRRDKARAAWLDQDAFFERVLSPE